MARRGKSRARRSGNGALPGWAWLLIGAALALALVALAPRYFKSGGREDGFFRPRPNPEARPAISALDEVDPPRPRPAPERPLPAPLSESDYDFYTLLPEQETAISDAELAARARAELERERAELERERARIRARAEAEPTQERARERARTGNTARTHQRQSRPATTPVPPTHPDAATPAKPPADETHASPAASSRYLLQAGAFSDPAEAESLKARIALLGLQAQVEAGTADGKPVHRVRLGPYASAAELAQIKQRLSNGGLSALAVRIE